MPESDHQKRVNGEAVAILATARMPLLIASGGTTPLQRRLVDGLLQLGALLLTDQKNDYQDGNILDLASPGPDMPLPEQAWKHAEEACKKTDLALVFEPINRNLATLADLTAWSGTRVMSVMADPDASPENPDTMPLDVHAALDWLQAVRAQKEMKS